MYYIYTLCADHCLLADDGQDLFPDTTVVFANDRHMRVTVEEHELVKVNKNGEKCRKADAFLSPWCQLRVRGGLSKTIAKIIK
jgi:hypothetical protein